MLIESLIFECQLQNKIEATSVLKLALSYVQSIQTIVSKASKQLSKIIVKKIINEIVKKMSKKISKKIVQSIAQTINVQGLQVKVCLFLPPKDWVKEANF